MDLNELESDLVESVLTRHGALAVTLTDAGDEPVLEPPPGETPLWRETTITALFDASHDLAALEEDLAATIAPRPLPELRIDTLEDRQWEREWLKDFAPMRFGSRLWVCPHGSTAPEDAVVVWLDPGLAFGTGSHETTALCLTYLDGIDLGGARVLDFGSGSGILGIAALKLGAARVAAVDIDRQALIATASNARANGVADRLRTAPEPGERFDVVLANVLARPLIEHAAELVERLRPGGRLALSGVLAAQVDEVSDAYRTDVDFAPPAFSGDWALLSGTRRQV